VCAFLSKYAYCSEACSPADFGAAYRCPAWNSLSGWRLAQNEASDAEAVCCRDAEALTTYVAFRGTESLKDVAVDLAVTKNRLPRKLCKGAPGDVRLYLAARVHGGFMYQFASLKPLFDACIEENPGDSVVLTGHSLGGALATLAALYMRVVHPDRACAAEVFGSPRVGNAALSRLVDSLGVPVLRHEHGADPVCRMPVRIRWKHCGTSLRHPRRGGAAEARGGDPLLRGCLALPNPFLAGHHSIDAYIDAVTPDASAPGNATRC